MNDNAELKIIQDAESALDTLGDASVVYELIKPLLNKNHPAAMFLYSTFSLAGMETEEEFEARRIDLLNKAAESGYLPAIFELAVCYELGDLVEQDHSLAGSLYRKAAEAGFPKAKLNHGLNLFYGSHGMPEDKELGLDFIKQAAIDNIDGADDTLEQLHKT